MPAKKNPKVDAYLSEATMWRKELEKLRGLLLGYGLTEELKWDKPCYVFEKSNVVVLLPLKNYCALLFCKGALLKDTEKLLVKAGENTQAARQIRVTTLAEIVEKEAILKGYIQQAIEVEKAGLDVVYKKTSEYAVPEEFQKKLKEDRALKAAYEALTPGRQRSYLLHFSSAKQATTREARIEKCRAAIFEGKGFNER